jgi:hypothetical protein
VCWVRLLLGAGWRLTAAGYRPEASLPADRQPEKAGDLALTALPGRQAEHETKGGRGRRGAPRTVWRRVVGAALILAAR